MLALAGMDLAPSIDSLELSYSTRALHHQQQGVLLFQELLRRNSQAPLVNVFSIVLVILALASAHAESTEPTVISALLRGQPALGRRKWEEIRESHVSALAGGPDLDESKALHEDVIDCFDRLTARYTHDEVCAKEMILLGRGRGRSTQAFDVTGLGQWPATMSDAFFKRLREHQPEALTILGHYSIVLGRSRKR